MTTVPGFSSRDTTSTIRQFPMRDEALMSETPGWSNSGGTEDAPAKPVAEADSKVVQPAVAESKTVRKATPRKQG